MSRFNELSKNINTVLDNLIKNQDLCKLLKYNTYNPKSEQDINNTVELLYDKIYPLPFTPDIKGDKHEPVSVLNVIFDDFKLGKTNRYFKRSNIEFVILCHKDIWRIDGNLRPFAIMHEIDTMFNSNQKIGVGDLGFELGKIMWANELYAGYKIVYKNYEFN